MHKVGERKHIPLGCPALALPRHQSIDPQVNVFQLLYSELCHPQVQLPVSTFHVVVWSASQVSRTMFWKNQTSHGVDDLVSVLYTTEDSRILSLKIVSPLKRTLLVFCKWTFTGDGGVLIVIECTLWWWWMGSESLPWLNTEAVSVP